MLHARRTSPAIRPAGRAKCAMTNDRRTLSLSLAACHQPVFFAERKFRARGCARTRNCARDVRELKNTCADARARARELPPSCTRCGRIDYVTSRVRVAPFPSFSRLCLLFFLAKLDFVFPTSAITPQRGRLPRETPPMAAILKPICRSGTRIK